MGKRILVDVERGRTVRGWKPRRLGGGLGGRPKRVEPVSMPPPRGGGFRGGFSGGRGFGDRGGGGGGGFADRGGGGFRGGRGGFGGGGGGGGRGFGDRGGGGGGFTSDRGYGDRPGGGGGGYGGDRGGFGDRGGGGGGFRGDRGGGGFRDGGFRGSDGGGGGGFRGGRGGGIGYNGGGGGFNDNGFPGRGDAYGQGPLALLLKVLVVRLLGMEMGFQGVAQTSSAKDLLVGTMTGKRNGQGIEGISGFFVRSFRFHAKVTVCGRVLLVGASTRPCFNRAPVV
ncbi:hypothetical protein B0H19DRAFT_551094 [Mycena capillaripes]|nr:hypothetical protein B0H19DRAFT_551094 [Mycena capillaripes]